MASTAARSLDGRWCGVLLAILLWNGAGLCLRAGEPARDSLDEKNVSRKPKLIRSAPPPYPYDLSRAGLIGEVNIDFVIDTQGTVKEAYVVDSNNPWFERPAIDAVLKWKFTPGEVNGHLVNVRARQLIKFELDFGGQVPELWRITKGKDQAKLPTELQWYTAPTPARTAYPVYPFNLLKTATAGSAKVSYVVGPTGRVIKTKLLEATAPEFGAAVLAMIDAWHFIPAKKKDGNPCYAALGSTYEFKPSGRGEVPVSEEARDILRDLAKRPAAIASLNELDHPLKPMSRRPPLFPTELIETTTEGMAVIEFFVDKNGDAQLPSVVSSTAPAFGYAAVQAVATWRFEPPEKNHRPVVARAQIPIQFKRADAPGDEKTSPQ